MNRERGEWEVYEGHGIRFNYPDDWELEESENEDGASVVLESPVTVTLTVSILPSCPRPVEVIEQILDIFKSEYEEVDVYEPAERTFGEYSVMTQELEFVCHELINVVKIIAIRTYQFTILMMSQGYDQDMEEFNQVLENIFQSLEVLNDDDELVV
jgi:hypothetical protein